MVIFGKLWRRLRRLFDRSEWSSRWIYPRKSETAEQGVNSPGVLLLQIDGLAYNELLRAIDNKRLPFLQRLIQKDHFVLRPFYSGLPSSTPAVQAELFFGLRHAVPAFSYYDRDEKQEKVMFDAQAVDTLAKELEQRSDSLLLSGGSSYSNIYAGGANEAPFCIQSMRLESIYSGFKLKKVILFPIIHLIEILRIIGLSLIEVGLACVDFCKGVLKRKNPFKEFKFIFSRIGACIVLRELVRLRVKIDIVRGMPIIHANFVGYDEHSHRRGPASAFAHWTLKGIDSVVQDLVTKAVRSERRDYQIVIYSDHGQEHSLDFQTFTGRTIHQAVAEAFNYGILKTFDFADPGRFNSHVNLRKRSTTMLHPFKNDEDTDIKDITSADKKIHIMAMGPLGHIYLPRRPDIEQMRLYAGRLVRQGNIPLVLHIEDDRVMCTSGSGTEVLSAKAEEILGSSHPFLKETAADLEAICRHRHAGDFIISCWQPNRRPLTFPIENGSHGGPGIQETRGFVIIPESLQTSNKPYYRAIDLRNVVLDVLARRNPEKKRRDVAPFPDIFRVMTYNVHSCIGVDGKHLPERIARIIKRQNPDFVALQEIDRFQKRSAMQDQAALLGDWLDMNNFFWSVHACHGGDYGLAVLSRHPISHAECHILPCLAGKDSSEKRGIMHIALDTPHGKMHLFNTHLSLYRKERFAQMKQIINGDILAAVPPAESMIFCGDLNTSTNTPTHRLLSSKLIDVEQIRPSMSSEPTFYSSWPLLRLDHIFHSNHFKPVKVEVINDWECRLASDHLPVLATLETKTQTGEQT